VNDEKRSTALVAGQSASEGMNGSALTVAAETSASATAERAKAIVQAAYVMARSNPRDLMAVRQRLLNRCMSPRFAEVAIFAKPQGKNQDGTPNVVRGLSIRFAEAAIQAYGNIRVETNVLFDTPERRILEVTVTDLETNAAYSGPIAFEKTIERKKIAPSAKPVEVRTNSYGDAVYILRATDDEVTMKQNALVSKAIRTLGLRLIPGELLDEAKDVIADVQSGEIKADPGAVVRRMVDAFARGGVNAAALQEYLGHSLDIVTPDEIVELKGLSQAIADKETTWREALAEKMVIPAAAGSAPDQGPTAPKQGGDAIAEKWKRNKAAKAETPAPSAVAASAVAESRPSAREPGEEG
jgi:hypothetical protein